LLQSGIKSREGYHHPLQQGSQQRAYITHLKQSGNTGQSTQLRLPAGKVASRDYQKNLSMYFSRHNQTMNSSLIVWLLININGLTF